MKRLMTCGAVCMALFGTAAFAGDIRWTGNAKTTDWNTKENWEGGAVPGEGDTAVIPDNAKVVVNGSDVAATLNALKGITMEGDGTVLCLSNLSTIVSMTVPLSGRGSFQHVDQVYSSTVNDNKSYHALTLSADNSNYAGVFACTNAGLQVNHDNALGGVNGGALYMKTKNLNRLAISGYRTLYNDVYLNGAGDGKTLFIAYNGGRWKGNIYIYGGFGFHTNTSGYTFTIEGDVIFKAKCGAYFTGGGGKMQFFGKVSNPYSDSCYSGSFEIGGKPYEKNFGNLFATGTIKCLGPNLFGPFPDRYSGLRFGNGSSMTLDMNGYDQDLFLIRPNNKAYIKSMDKPATLTISGGMCTWNQTLFTTITDNGGADMLQGHISYVYNPTNVTQHWCYGRLQNMHCTTDGGLTVMKSRFVIADTATFSNLTALVACGTTEYLKVETTGLNPVNGLNELAVSNTAKMVFKDGMVQKTKFARLASTAKLEIGAGSYVKVAKKTFVDGVALKEGVYGKVGGKYADGSDIPAEYQLSCLKGDGWLETKGPCGLVLIIE